MNDHCYQLFLNFYLPSLFFLVHIGIMSQTPVSAQIHQNHQEKLFRLIPSPSSPTAQVSPENNYNIETIEVTGSTLFSEEDIAPIIEPLLGKTATRQELLNLVNEITQLYLEAGYLTSRAVLIEESLATNQIEIRVLEGRLASIEIEGLRRLNPDYARSRLQLAAQPLLNTTRLENQLRLLRANPLIDTIEANLRAGENLQESILVVRIQEANPWLARASLDNYSPPSVGSENATVTIGNRNLTGNGDTLKVSYSRTIQGGAEDIDLNYTLPLNAKNGTIELRSAFGRNEVIEEDLEDYNIEGDFDLVEIIYNQPLLRTPQEEFVLSLGFTYQKGETFLLGEPYTFSIGAEDGISRTSLIKFGQTYIKRGENGAWAARSRFNLGTTFFDATENQGDTPDGQFISWLGQIQRVQVLSENNLLIIQADIKLASDELLSSQQFVIGGGQSIRGYRQNILAGDQGIRLSVEDQITLQENSVGNPLLKIAPFFDIGTVFNRESNPNTISQEKTVIAGIGLGILWNPISNLNIRIDYGLPLINLENTGNNIQDDGLYFNLTYTQ